MGTKELVKQLEECNYQINKNTEKLGHLTILIMAIYSAATGKDKISKIPLILVLVILIMDNVESLISHLYSR